MYIEATATGTTLTLVRARNNGYTRPRYSAINAPSCSSSWDLGLRYVACDATESAERRVGEFIANGKRNWKASRMRRLRNFPDDDLLSSGNRACRTCDSSHSRARPKCQNKNRVARKKFEYREFAGGDCTRHVTRNGSLRSSATWIPRNYVARKDEGMVRRLSQRRRPDPLQLQQPHPRHR